ncbi:MAG: thioredoxin family protein [Porphyromonadaceae bacterium]|nr:thioredoxin family protein [Porphyromonadaceae bacterium]
MKLKFLAIWSIPLLSLVLLLSSCEKDKPNIDPTPEKKEEPKKEKEEPKKEEPSPKKMTIKTDGKVLHFLPADIEKYIWDYKKHKSEFVYKADKVCVIDFNATWCAPCRALKPHLDLLAKKYDGQAYFIGVDIDQSDSMGSNKEVFKRCLEIFYPTNKQFGGSIPAMILVSADGKKIKTLVGFSRKVLDELNAFVEEHK